jgi:hypothetical protein
MSNYGPPVPPGRPAVQERNSALVLVLSIVTCGIYYFYWIYATSSELADHTGDRSINPTVDVLLCVVTCGLWGMFVQYRNAQKVHGVLVAHDPYAKDQSQTILILSLVSFIVGVTGLVAMFMTQEELNRLARPLALPR